MSFKALTFLQYAYGKYITNLVIKRELLFIKEENNVRKLKKLKGRIIFTQLLMPSKYSTDYKDKMPYLLGDEVRYDETVFYTDRHGLLQHGDEEKNGTKGFIEKVHQCCEEYLPKLEELSLKLNVNSKKAQTTAIKTKNEIEKDLSISVEDLYDFLVLHFNIDVKKELFINENKSSSIIIRGLPINKLSNKELTKYQIGYLFEYLLKEFSNLRSRVMFSYRGQGLNDNIEYKEAIKALNDHRKEIKSGKITNRNLARFADNLEKEFNIFKENKKTL